MKKISIYCISKTDPASYYRIIQYIDKLKIGNARERYFSSDWVFKLYMNSSNKRLYKPIMALLGYFRRLLQLINDLLVYKPDYIFIQRTIFPRYDMPILNFIIKKTIKKYKNRLIWDFDDYIKLKESSANEFALLEMYSKAIIVTNEYLMNSINEKFHYKIIMLPTTDFSLINYQYRTIETHKNYLEKPICISWIGTHYSYSNLSIVLPILDDLADELITSRNIRLKLRIVSNLKKLDFTTNFLDIELVKWSYETVINSYKDTDIGIMPLTDTEFNKGKGSFKAIQYLGASIPTVISEIGNLNNVVVNGVNGFSYTTQLDFKNKVKILAIDSSLRHNMSLASRKHWLNNFNPIHNISVINSLLKDGACL